MAVHGCVKQIVYDDGEDDDGPTIFKRPKSTSRQVQLNSASKKPASQQREDSLARPRSDESASNGEKLHWQKSNTSSTAKISNEKSTVVSSSSRVSVRHRLTSSKVSTPDMSCAEAGTSDDSDDDKPLSHRLNAACVAVQRNNTLHAEKVVKQSLDHKLTTNSRDKSSSHKYGKTEVSDDTDEDIPHRLTSSKVSTPDMSCAEAGKSDDSDDDKPLSHRLNAACVAVQRNNTLHAEKVVKQSLDHKLTTNSRDKSSSHKYGKTEVSDDTDEDIPHRLTSSKVSTPDMSCAEAGKSDDSDDDKPLSHRLNAACVAVQRNNTLHAEKVVKQSLDHKLTTNSRDKSSSHKYGKTEVSGDTDEDIPLSSKFPSLAAAERSSSMHATKKFDSVPTSPPSEKPKAKIKIKEDSEDSEDDKPLLLRFQSKSAGGTSTQNSDSNEKPFASELKPNGLSKKEAGIETRSPRGLNKRPLGDNNCSTGSFIKKAKICDASVHVKVKNEVKKEMETDDNDHIPITQRMKKLASSEKSSTKKAMKITSSSFKKDSKKFKKTMKNSEFSKTLKVPPGSGGGQKWTTLEHNGVIFPPLYKPHGVKMLYNGQPVDLTPEQEEVATMFAVMKDTDYATKPKFIENFWNDWKQILGKNHIIKKFELCDFTPIYEWHLREKEKKKQMSSEEKKALKEEKLKQEEKYMWAIVDGVKEKVGNFRVEPPGLFRGRGEHPKMGKLKKRIRPSDITINIGKGAPVTECPIPGERWKEVKHDNTVTWLAFWNDPINPKEFKYVFLAASSTLKGQSDKEKYEKARLLKNYIHNIRTNYTRDFTSKDASKRQIAVATYLIDKLALRAGNEKDDDEADTVGCCTLKVENVVLVPPNKLQFDFLGKDSIRYFNTVEVELPVYKAIGEFRTAKKSGGSRKSDGDDLFDLLDTSKLNAHLKELMPGLTAKVFRTYNASITLDDILNKETKDATLPEKIAVYQHANKEVAIICNHQRSVSKSHNAQMSRLNEKINDLKAQRDELKVDLSRAKKGKPPLKDADGKQKKNLSREVIEKKLATIETKIEKLELDKKVKEDLKTVALGTSKINYLDPRITVSWCKRHEVPIEKIFNKSLLAKFAWAMDVDPSFRF